MGKNNDLVFNSPSLKQRVKSMLLVDFYRLFHTPLLYIFLAIAAIIPAMILGTTGVDGATSMYSNTWQLIASDKALYVVTDIGEYANMNMVFIFGGIMLSIFIGHDYRSGYVKQLFTSHPKKQDYLVSKTIVGAFSMICMCMTYFWGTLLSGLLVGASMQVSFGSLVCAILGKMLMSLGWASLYVFLNIIFRKYFWISICSSFFLGTGILIIGMASIVGNLSILNIFLYGSSVFACLSSNFLSVVICLLISVFWTIFYNIVGTIILNKSDVY